MTWFREGGDALPWYTAPPWWMSAFAASVPPPDGYIPYAPSPKYGRDLLEGLDNALRATPVICTQPEPWVLVKGAFPASATVHFVTDVEHATVAARSDAWKKAIEDGELAPVSAVFGIGGGSALDHAKFTSRALAVPLVLCPSILSVDAGYTVAAGVREITQTDAGPSKLSVVYVGDTRPAELLVDFALLQAAPAILNRSGIGDLLSCATALWDWEEARTRLGERFDDAIATRTRALLDRLLQPSSAAEVREVSEEGLRLLSELYVEEVTLCEMWGNARPEEGSEHYVAYALEALTGKHYLHGQLITLCVILVAAHQKQEELVTRVVDFACRAGIDCSFGALGTNRDELFHVLTTMGDFVASEPQLLPGVFHFGGNVPANEANALLDMAESAFVTSSAPNCEACPPCGDADSSWWDCARCRSRRPSRKPGAAAFQFARLEPPLAAEARKSEAEAEESPNKKVKGSPA